MRYSKSNALFKKTRKTIPLASQTFSKSYLQYIKGVAPLFITRAKGARVWDADGNEYIDFINGLSAISLGYAYPATDNAIKKQLKDGIIFSLPSPLEHELAKLLTKLIPCAEMVRFGKNGSDSTAAAVRLARAVTKRDHVAVCGYHGWRDWYIGSTTRNKGVPKAVRELTHTFKYNDLDSLEKILKKHKCAAVIMEPISYTEPKNNFLQNVKKLAHKHGALLVFDEIVTGFRISMGGAQKYFKVTPDIATFGKSMANGMPISAIVGKKKYMKHLEDIFFSFTFGGECLSLAATIATIREMQKRNFTKQIWEKGEYLTRKTRAAIREAEMENVLEIKGLPFWQVLVVRPTSQYSEEEIKSYLQQEILAEGILWYGHHNLTLSHTKKDLDALISAYKKSFKKLKKALDNKTLKKELRGKPITNIFKIRSI